MAESPSARPSLSRPFSRRNFLAFAGAGGAAAAAALQGFSSAPAWAAPRFSADPFALGVASGDPAADGFVLWTRLAPDPLAPDGRGGMPRLQVPVAWQVATDAQMRRVVRAGVAKATPELGHSVHPEIRGLRPGRDYWYRFRVGDAVSTVGHARTAPAPTTTPAHMRFALASCQSLPGNGRYGAYRAMLEEDLDLVVHVGDYTYERADDESLADFRVNHARYKLSPDLQAAHAAFPFVVTFDDHEIENNWADGVSQPDSEPSNRPSRFLRLRANAFQAYYEHLPLRLPQRPSGPDMLLHRRLAWGTLARFHVLDTRQYRSDQLSEAFPGGPQHPAVDDPSRSLMGDEQEQWLFGGLERSPARWNLLAQQTIMAQVDYDGGPGLSVNHDQWDGYTVSRRRFLSFVEQAEPANPVVLTGDWHSAWVNDLRMDFARPETPVLATEVVGTSISSGCGWAAAVKAAQPNNPHVRYLNPDLRGYTRLTVTPQMLRADYRVVPSASDITAGARTDASWVVEHGRPGAVPG
jgi:alkaline phosphatase D